MTVYHGRRAAAIENQHFRVTVLREGGHIAEILDKNSGINPLWTPPWRTSEPSAFGPAVYAEYGSDIDFSWRLQLAGYELRLVRDAVVMYRERDTIADIAKQFFHYGEAMPALYRKFRADGMPKSSTREAAQAWLEICVLWLVAWRSPRVERLTSMPGRSGASAHQWRRHSRKSTGRV